MTSQRIDSLDLLRGVAVFGILLLNIISFGMPIAAYINPTAYGEFSGLNQATWLFTHLFAEQKFVAMFALLFGAGVALFAERAEARGLSSPRLHYRRMGWLLVFGALHGWLLWYGDILFTYAVAGMLVFLMRNLRTSWLLFWAALFFSIPIFLAVISAWSMQYWSDADFQEVRQFWAPDQRQLLAEINAMTGSYAEQFRQRSMFTGMMQTQMLLLDYIWRASSFMLLGIALYRWRVITGEKSLGFYQRLALLLVPGYLLILFGVQQKFNHGFSMEQSMFLDTQWNYLGSVPVMLGYLALIVMWQKSSALSGLQYRLRAVGRTAFSCYIMQTLIAVVIFYGMGFFAQVERFGLLLIVFSIWALQLGLAPWYLRHYRQGPLEALWRKLTYGVSPAAQNTVSRHSDEQQGS